MLNHQLGLSFHLKRLHWNILSVWGLRGYQERQMPLIILNRILRRFNKFLCQCGRVCYFSEVYGVINDDCSVCPTCFEEIMAQ